MNVKWIGSDGGWKVGKIVRVDLMEVTRFNRVLVQHSHTNELEFVLRTSLSPYMDRSQRGEEPYGSNTVKQEPVGV